MMVISTMVVVSKTYLECEAVARGLVFCNTHSRAFLGGMLVCPIRHFVEITLVSPVEDGVLWWWWWY